MFRILFVSAHFPAFLSPTAVIYVCIYMHIYEGDHMLEQIAMVRLLPLHLLFHGTLMTYRNHQVSDHASDQYVSCYRG